jgi:hypothetical protein
VVVEIHPESIVSSGSADVSDCNVAIKLDSTTSLQSIKMAGSFGKLRKEKKKIS